MAFTPSFPLKSDSLQVVLFAASARPDMDTLRFSMGLVSNLVMQIGHWYFSDFSDLSSQYVLMQFLQKVWPQGMVTGILKRSRQMTQVKFEFWESIFNHERDTPMEKWKKEDNQDYRTKSYLYMITLSQNYSYVP